MSLLKSLMSEFISMDGVIAVVIADRAGFVIEKSGLAISDQVLGPMIATAIAVADGFVGEIKRGGIGVIVIETDIGFMAISSLTNYENVAVVANSINLGKVLYKLKQMKPAFLEALL